MELADLDMRLAPNDERLAFEKTFIPDWLGDPRKWFMINANVSFINDDDGRLYRLYISTEVSDRVNYYIYLKNISINTLMVNSVEIECTFTFLIYR